MTARPKPPAAPGSAAVSRSETQAGLRHLVLLISRYIETEEARPDDGEHLKPASFGAYVVEQAALLAREHLGWQLRERLEWHVARALDVVASEYRRLDLHRNGHGNLAAVSEWRGLALNTLRIATGPIAPTEAELNDILDRFLTKRIDGKREGDGIVEPLADAIQSVIGGRGVRLMLDLRREIQKGMPITGGGDPWPDALNVLSRFCERGDAPNHSALVRATLKRTKPRARQPMGTMRQYNLLLDMMLGASPGLDVPNAYGEATQDDDPTAR